MAEMLRSTPTLCDQLEREWGSRVLMLVKLLPWMREHRTLQVRRVVCYGLIGAVFSFAQVSDWGARLYELALLPARWVPTWRGGFGVRPVDGRDVAVRVTLCGIEAGNCHRIGRAVLGRAIEGPFHSNYSGNGVALNTRDPHSRSSWSHNVGVDRNISAI